jgi:serine/threonine-protein kinase RsbW
MIRQPILANVSREEFVGREAELHQLVQQARRTRERRRLLLLAAPGVGAAELFRQTYDELFLNRADAIPIYFAFERDRDLAHNARRFFQTLLQQYIAYRRVDPSLVDAALTLHDLAELSPGADYDLISNLLEGFDRERAESAAAELLQYCLNTPQRLSRAGRKLFPLINTSELGISAGDAALAAGVAAVFNRSRFGFALAGLRRQILDALQRAGDGHHPGEVIHLEKLRGDEARRLVIAVARRYEVETNEPTRDLIVQQFDGNAFLISGFVQAASERKTSLTSFLHCQRLYVDELMGGRINRRFSHLLSDAAPNPQTRKNLLRVLFEAASSDDSRSSLWSWKKRIGADSGEFDRIIECLHVNELVNSTGAFVEVNSDSYVWTDYLRAHYRADVTGEPRALIVANTLMDSLKRAPQAMARQYRREAALGIRDLLSRFDCQEVPATLFHYDRFAALHKGAPPDEIHAALDMEADLIRLPQVVHVTNCAAFDATSRWEEERCAVAHGFEAGEYTDENEVVWLAAEIDSKVEVSHELAHEWLDRLSQLARECHFQNVRVWLVSREGFSNKARKLLKSRDAFASNQQQLELLTARVSDQAPKSEDQRPDEFEMVIPMGEDTELVAAHTVEQIARRVNFPPEAINQIKTAVVEACINAAEHSLSPDRKIYQRFRIEPDKLVVIVASRGIVPANVMSQNGERLTTEGEAGTRRGWGLKLIRTLMDEVEFRRVDDGTQLRMVKYRRQ